MDEKLKIYYNFSCQFILVSIKRITITLHEVLQFTKKQKNFNTITLYKGLFLTLKQLNWHSNIE